MRYGNVVGSRGSVVPIFKQQAATGVLTITDERMTRFWITLEAAVEFVLTSMELVQGGETFVPKIPSMRIIDLAKALAPDAELRVVGIRPGEKLHEVLLTEDEARQSVDLGDRYAIMPPQPSGGPVNGVARRRRCRKGSATRPTTTRWWLTTEELLAITDTIGPARRAADRGDGWEV